MVRESSLALLYPFFLRLNKTIIPSSRVLVICKFLTQAVCTCGTSAGFVL